jgi:hypothetical protein
VLLKQEKTEAVMAVDGRLEYIENEMYGITFFESLKFADGSIERESRSRSRILRIRVMLLDHRYARVRETSVTLLTGFR